MAWAQPKVRACGNLTWQIIHVFLILTELKTADGFKLSFSKMHIVIHRDQVFPSGSSDLPLYQNHGEQSTLTF